MAKKVALCIGSNLGDRSENIKKSVELIEKEFKAKLKKSNVYETPPFYYGNSVQNDFYNCCVAFESGLSAKEILKKANAIEKKIGRKEKGTGESRKIDVDVIFVGDEIVADDDLTIPHPSIQDRLFVLKPLSEIMGNFVHPAIQMTVKDLLYECNYKDKLKKIKGFW